MITTALRVPLRPHDLSFYTSTLLCCSSPYIFISPCSIVGISQLCDTPLPSLLADLFPVHYLTPTRIPHLRSNLFFYLFSDHTTCPFPFYPSLVSFFPYFVCYDHICRVLCTLLCVCPLSSTLWNVIACSSLDSMVLRTTQAPTHNASSLGRDGATLFRVVVVGT